jgi:hypothetical protein
MDNQLLIDVLKFYALEENYLGDNPIISKDNGFLARDVLKKIEKFDDFNQNLSDLYKKLEDTTSTEKKLEIIKQFNNIKNI